jgi:hydrogenase maturation protease
MRGYQNVVIIDAIKTESGKPGDLFLLTPDNFKETHHLSSFHDVSFLTGLKMGKKLGFDIPEVILIIAVEIVEDLIFDDSFSPEIQAKYEQIYHEIFTFLKPALQGDQSADQYRSLLIKERNEKI